MKLPISTIAFAFLTAAASRSSADTITPSSDSYITQHAGLGGPTSTHGSDPFLNAIGAATFITYPLIQFDLAAFAGQTVIGDATLRLYAEAPFGFAAPRTVFIDPILHSWDATTATYNSFGPTPGVQFGEDVGGSITAISIGGPGVGPQYFSWTIPGSVLQAWIDSPALNHGILVNNTGSNLRDLVISSSESAAPPELVFTVPEPNPALFSRFGAMILLAFGRRSHSTL